MGSERTAYAKATSWNLVWASSFLSSGALSGFVILADVCGEGLLVLVRSSFYLEARVLDFINYENVICNFAAY